MKATVSGNALRNASDRKDTNSRVELTGGTANAAIGFPANPSLGTGNVGDVHAVTALEVQQIAEAAVAGVIVSTLPGGFLEVRTVATGVTAQLQVRAATSQGFSLDTALHQGAASGAANALRVEGKDPGAYANSIEVEVRVPSSGEVGAFDLAVVEDGTYREIFPNVRMTPGAERYVERVINDAKAGSNLIRVIDQLLQNSLSLAIQTVQLAGGDDGLAGLDDNDFIGSATGKTAMHALDQVQDIALLLVPGRATSAVHNAMLPYCVFDRDGTVFAVLDPPAGMSAIEIVGYVEITAALPNLSEFGALYWPRVKVLNPSKAVFGSQDKLVVPPSGIPAGVYARTDATRPGGIYDPPAGIDAGRMFGVLGFETDEVIEERKRDLVYPMRINPLTTGPGLPRFIDGSRTLKGDGNFPYVAERRGVIFIERSLKQGLQFARHKNNTEGLRATVRRTITAFLLAQMNNCAFRTREPKTAFFVDVSVVGHAGFQKCSELSVEVANVQYVEGGSLIPNKSPGRVTFADVTLERGATVDRDLFDWLQDVVVTSSGLGLTDPYYKRNLDVVQQDRDGTTLRRWCLSRAWPTKFVAGEWDNEADENVIESVTLAYDFFELSAPG